MTFPVISIKCSFLVNPAKGILASMLHIASKSVLSLMITFPKSVEKDLYNTVVTLIVKHVETEKICKQCRPRSDCSIGAVWSGSALSAISSLWTLHPILKSTFFIFTYSICLMRHINLRNVVSNDCGISLLKTCHKCLRTDIKPHSEPLCK